MDHAARLGALFVPGLQQFDHFGDAVRTLLGSASGGVDPPR
jgi:hypothetical protein